MDGREQIEALLSQVARRDRAAFDVLYDRTSAKLYGVVLRVLNDDAAAQDALQTTYMKIWRAAGRFTPGATSPMTWLITIARNTAIDMLRSRKGQEVPSTEAELLPSRGLTPEAAAIANDEAMRVARCMAELKPKQRDAVRGAYLEGLTYADLAERTGTPLNTIRTWLRRALQSLRECLSQ